MQVGAHFGKSIPNPGSDEAIKEGCICSPWDNNHGRFAPMEGEWHIDPKCPVHPFDAEPERV